MEVIFLQGRERREGEQAGTEFAKVYLSVRESDILLHQEETIRSTDTWLEKNDRKERECEEDIERDERKCDV